MYSLNGIGTTLYGKSNVASDGSYVATKWFIFLLLPIIPLGSYRVSRGDTKMVFIGARTQYRMVPTKLDWKQIIQTYLLTYGVLLLIIIDVIYEPTTLYFLKSASVIGLLYSIYYLFKTGKKWWAILLIISCMVVGFSLLSS